MKLTRHDREQIARKRIPSILTQHGNALARTLEQKISDAGPFGQRIDPHILTPARNELVKEGRLVRSKHSDVPWFHLRETPKAVLQRRLAVQLPVFQALNHGSLSKRLGQTLEIATYRALLKSGAEFYGRFKDLNAHDDSTLYSKEEPPQHIGNRSLSGDQRLDFLARHPEAGHLGIECKNVREWLYPDRQEISEVLTKCIALDCVPVLVARRIPYVTFFLLTTCGAILHQHYNQLLPSADASLADQARHKSLLGYHDIRTGNEPDDRLLTFITQILMKIAPEARAKFDAYKDLLAAFASGEMLYAEFAARVRRRSQGQKEDNDFPEPADWQ